MIIIVATALAIWLVLIAAKIHHGIARGILLVPYLGDFRARQIGVFTGSLIVLGIALFSVRWIGAARSSHGFASRRPPAKPPTPPPVVKTQWTAFWGDHPPTTFATRRNDPFERQVFKEGGGR